MSPTFRPLPGLWLGLALILLALPAAAAPLTLPQAVERLYQSHPRARALDAAVAAARAREAAAGQPLYNPELSLEAERSDVTTTSLGWAQTLDRADRRGARAAVARAEREAAEAERAAGRLDLAGELLGALAEWHSARDRAALAERRVELMARFREQAERRRQAGDIPRIELTLARQSALQAELAAARARAALSRARQRLAALLPGAAESWPALPTDLPALDPPDADTLLPTLPALRAAEARLAAARARVELRRRERRADPTLGLHAGRDGGDTLVGLALSIPLHVRNPLRAEVRAASAEAGQARAELAAVRRRLRGELLAAAEDYRQVRGAWRRWQQAGAPGLAEQADLLARLWRASELSTADYLVQLDQTLDTRAEALAVRGELWQRWFHWLVTSARLNQWLGLGEARPAPAQEQRP